MKKAGVVAPEGSDNLGIGLQPHGNVLVAESRALPFSPPKR